VAVDDILWPLSLYAVIKTDLPRNKYAKLLHL